MDESSQLGEFRPAARKTLLLRYLIDDPRGRIGENFETERGNAVAEIFQRDPEKSGINFLPPPPPKLLLRK